MGKTYFVELVNAADAIVGKNKGTSLEDQLARFRILGDVGSQTDSWGTFARSILRPEVAGVIVLLTLTLMLWQINKLLSQSKIRRAGYEPKNIPFQEYLQVFSVIIQSAKATGSKLSKA